ncbi:hypothetical protein [Sphingobacterium luzhongxinii]|uniref:hypothetical protein n=1 Tax=Sphingobacterium luzhongxinii TaxID=2654181 RepID=UPI0013DC7B44|nr:hypothetical protein [Sphingobacterium sp. xlx-73]
MTGYGWTTTVKQWAGIGLFNLGLVASMGILMRLKFIIPMSFINLKYMQHAHSHFAFAGWVTQTLMLCLVVVTFRLQKAGRLPRHYVCIFWANLICSLGMLFSFLYQGYGGISITFSSLSILVSFWFVVALWRDMEKQQLDQKIARWFRLAMIFLALSAIGTFYLAYIMSTHQANVQNQLASVYFYLHFQYNGWFFFAILGLACHVLKQYGVILPSTDLLYKVLSIVTVPLYLLSVLWWDMGDIVYILLVLAAIGQCCVWGYWMISLYKKNRKSSIPIHGRIKVILWLVCWAILLKVLLQSLSVIPSLSHFVYGFRPVIVGYLHLVLLLIVSIFILSFLYKESLIEYNRYAMFSFNIFILGAVMNEIFLALQALLALGGTSLPYAHFLLLAASIVIGIGLTGMMAHRS